MSILDDMAESPAFYGQQMRDYETPNVIGNGWTEEDEALWQEERRAFYTEIAEAMQRAGAEAVDLASESSENNPA